MGFSGARPSNFSSRTLELTPKIIVFKKSLGEDAKLRQMLKSKIGN